MSEPARALRQNGWFCQLTAVQQQNLWQAARPVHCAAGQPLFRRGDAFCGIYLVQDGQLLISGLHSSGREALLTLVGPAGFFGEIAWFDQQSRTHDAVALTDCQLLQWSKTALQQLVSADPLWWQRFGQLVTAKLRQVFVELEDRSVLSARQRLARKLCQLAPEPGMRIPLQQEQLGQLLSLSRQTTNQLLRQLVQAGLIRTHYATLEIVDVAALRQWAEC